MPLRRAGISAAECARQLGFCRQTIYNELDRGGRDVIREHHGYYHDVREYSADKGRPQNIGNRRAYTGFLSYSAWEKGANENQTT